MHPLIQSSHRRNAWTHRMHVAALSLCPPLRHPHNITGRFSLQRWITAPCMQTAESCHLHEPGSTTQFSAHANVHFCIAAANKPQSKRPFCLHLFLVMRWAEIQNKHTSTSVTGGEAGRRRSGAYLKNAQSAAGPLLGLEAWFVWTGRVNWQPQECEASSSAACRGRHLEDTRCSTALRLSLPLPLCISLLSNDAQKRGHATFNVRERAPSHEHVKNQLEPYSCFCGAQCAAVRVCDGLLLRFNVWDQLLQM